MRLLVFETVIQLFTIYNEKPPMLCTPAAFY